MYDSDYSHEDDDDDDDDEDDNDSNEDDTAGLGLGNGRKNNTNTTTCCAKINQDRGGIAYPYANSTQQALFAVYDGHGEGGELVSQYALGEVQRLLMERLLQTLLPPLNTNNWNYGATTTTTASNCKGVATMACSCISEDKEGIGDINGGGGGSGGGIEEDNSEQHNEEETIAAAKKEGAAEKEEQIISEAMREVFVKVDRGLLDEADIEVSVCKTSGEICMF